MTNKERAIKLMLDVVETESDYITPFDDVVNMVLAYADEIRRECADRAAAWAKRYGGDDGYEVTIDKLRAAIMGKED